MTDHNAVSWFFLNSLKPEVNKVMDIGALLAESGLISRGYLDAKLTEKVRLDAVNSGEFRIFPVQRHIYDHIYTSEQKPEMVYDMIFFLNTRCGECLDWAVYHGKKIVFNEKLLYPDFLNTGLSASQIEIYQYKDCIYYELDIQKMVCARINVLIEEEKNAEALKNIKDWMCLARENIFLLKAAIGIAADMGRYEDMWMYAADAYRLDPEDSELKPIYEKMKLL